MGGLFMNRLYCAIMMALAMTIPAYAQTSGSNSNPSKPEDYSDYLGFLMGAEGGGGFLSSPRQPTAYAGVKIGGNGGVLSLGYDRIHARSGASGEFTGMFPMVRFPGLQKDESKNYLRLYLEPGIGYRVGGGGFGPYFTAKAMLAFLSDKRLTSDKNLPSPYLEFERRFPFSSLSHGDNRIAFGLMLAICHHCGFN